MTKSILAVALLAACAASCSQREDMLVDGTVINIKVSRATLTDDPDNNDGDGTWGGPYSPRDPGTQFENDVQSVMAQIIAGGKTYFVPMTDVVKRATYYDCIGKTSELLPTDANAKLMVWINSRPETSIDNVGATTYPFNQIHIGGSTPVDTLQNHSLPMWGVKTISLVAGKAMQQFGTIDVLRSVARLDILLATNLRNEWQIKSANVMGLETNGYVAPLHYANVDSTKLLNFADNSSPVYCFNPFTSTSQNKPTGVFTISPIDQSMAKLYIPETNRNAYVSLVLHNTTDGKDYTFIDVDDADNTHNGFHYTAPLKRNHIYRVTIESVTKPGNASLTFHYHVCPWHQEVVDIPSFE